MRIPFLFPVIVLGLATTALSLDLSNPLSLLNQFLSDQNNPGIAQWASAPGANQTLLEAIETAVNNTRNQLKKLLAPELYYSYGRSPPVYPSPVGDGHDGGWEDSYSRAKALVARMTDLEKAGITLGDSDAMGCSGFTGSVARLNFPGMCLNDASSGVRGGALVNGYASGLSVGASWNRDLALRRARALGREFRAKGVNVLLGPVIGPLGRVTTGGRNWEGFSVDPYLAGELVYPTITGIQESVVACVKHFLLNEQETNRQPFLLGFIPGLGNQSVSSNVDDRTLHELYLWPWSDAVRAEVGSVMCAYNRVNGSHACQNSKLLNGLLKTELGFRGFVVSDWYATHTGVASNNAGLDMVMPTSQQLTPLTLSLAVLNGSVPRARLDDQATRILASWFRYAQFGSPSVDSNTTDARDPAADDVILQSAIEGHVLVKNVNGALPWQPPPTALNVFGYDAPGGSNSSDAGLGLGAVSLANTQSYSDGRPFSNLDYTLFGAQIAPSRHAGPRIALNGTLLSGGGSGGITPTASISPLDALAAHAAQHNIVLHVDTTSLSPAVQDPSAPCLVLVNAQSAESWDRASLDDPASDALILGVAAQCAHTIVVTHNAGTVLLESWIEHPNISAVLLAHVPGQASGLALTQLLYGAVSPSGRLPYTIARRASDYGAVLDPSYPTSQDPLYSQSDFAERLSLDYRRFLDLGVAPRFAFGHGLTYASFAYADLAIVVAAGADKSAFPPPNASSSRPVPQGGLPALYDVLVTVQVSVQNVAAASAAAEVAQLYLSIPTSGQPRVLRGFVKTAVLEPGQSERVLFALRRRDLSVWDVDAQQWRLPVVDDLSPPGNTSEQTAFAVYVGRSVLDVQLTGSFSL